MKRWTMLLLALAMMITAVSVLWARRAATRPGRAARPAAASRLAAQPGAGKSDNDLTIERMTKVCALSPEQQTQVREIMEEQQAAAKTFRTANAEKFKAAQDALRAAQEAKDDEAIKKARADWEALQTQQFEAQKNYNPMSVLTAEQRAKWQAFGPIQGIAFRYRAADLTAEQLAQIQTAWAEMDKDLQAAMQRARQEAMQKLDAKINELLTPEQKEAMQKAQDARGGPATRPGQ